MMLNEHLLSPEVQAFICSYEGSLHDLAFKGSPFENVDSKQLLQQIEGKRIAKTKLPTWYKKRGIVYPPKVNLEQTSSQITAAYKSSLLKGKRIADLTGGFGIDAFYFAQEFEKVYYFEVNEALSKLAAHNFKILNSVNIECINEDGVTGIKDLEVDTVYLDPSRRTHAKGKVFFLSDCEPDITKHAAELLHTAKQIMIKTSPMLDLSAGYQDLPNVAQIHVVAVDNEVKEVLWVLDRSGKEVAQVTALNLTKKGVQSISFDWNEDGRVSTVFPKNYLYEPNAAIMKSNGFYAIYRQLGLSKLHTHSHLFTSEKLVDFPGRTFEIKENLEYSKANLRKIKGTKANITTRNFNETVKELRKKWNLREGGDRYIFFTTNQEDKKRILICNKIS